MTDQIPSHHVKEMKRLYGDDEAEEAMQGLIEEVRPTTFHKRWHWSGKIQYGMYNLPTILVCGFLLYLVIPTVPKTPWTVAIAVCVLVVSLSLFGFGMYIPPLKASRFPYHSAVWWMGGGTACGLERVLATFPYVDAADAVRLERISDQEIRNWIGVIREKLYQRLYAQKDRLKQMGVETLGPAPPPSGAETISAFFKTPPTPSLYQKFLAFFFRPSFFTSLILLVTAWILWANLASIIILSPFMPLVGPITLLALVVLVIIGVILLLLPWLRTPPPPTNPPPGDATK